MAEKLINIDISKEMQTSFLDYAMSVIVSRALPDVRDGLKPVHRRILYAMVTTGLTPDKKYRKSASTVGEVLGKYHPHGDVAVYDSMVRMAQDFSYRYPLVDGHGNFGSIDGDSAAAHRYTEAKLSKISMELLKDINKDTVNFIDNYDGSEKEPVVLPSRFPSVLVNGATGIAVGMATNIPPHNLGEVIDGVVLYLENPDVSLIELMEKIKGPDFPTGALILGNSGIKKAYETGRGIITVRAKAEILEKTKQEIIVTEIPYQVNKSSLITRIAELVREKIIEGISDLRDESNRNGIKIVIEIKKEHNANVVLNNLYKHTALQNSYGINLLALVDGQPRLLGLKDTIKEYASHQRIVVIRRTKFELERAEKRAHVLEGLKIALDNIDAIIKLIKAAKSDQEASNTLKERFSLTQIQADAILEMKLRRLTGLERGKIEEELRDLQLTIKDLKEILASEQKILDIIKTEMLAVKEKFNDNRRTKIDMTSIEYIEDESLIPVEEIIVTLTNKGYIKRIPVATYKTQNKGGVGVKGMTINEDDFVQQLQSLTTHDYILLFTNKGKVYRIKGYEVPEYGRQAKGLPIINLLPIEKEEVVNSMLVIKQKDITNYLLFATKFGYVKRTPLKEFEKIRLTGKIAISLKEQDELIGVKKTDGNQGIILASSKGRMVRFAEREVRVMGRTTTGVRGINLEDSLCVGVEITDEEKQVLTVTEKGYGKRTSVGEYRLTHRGSKGVKSLNITEKTGNIVAFKIVDNEQELMVITNSGMLIRIPVEQISVMSRVTQGVRLITLKGEQRVTAVFDIKKEEEHLEEVNK